MSKFKVGDTIRVARITRTCVSNLKVGDTAIIDELYFNRDTGFSTSARMLCDKNKSSCFHSLKNIELAKPKWTIYNNTLTWQELSDEQKGEMLLAQLEGVSIKLVVEVLCGPDRFINCEEIDTSETVVYRAEPVPAKPEPTMAELFDTDANSFDFRRSKDFPEYMISIGWAKKC